MSDVPFLPLTPISGRQKKKTPTTHVPSNAPSDQYRELSQYFTNPEWAQRLVQEVAVRSAHAALSHGLLYGTIIEPSAGEGAFSRALPKRHIACEIYEPFHETLKQYSNTVTGDFFALQRGEGILEGCNVTLVIGNPPYEYNQDVRFVQQAFNIGEPDVTVAMLLQTKFLNTRIRRRGLWQYVFPERIIAVPRSSIDHVGNSPQHDYCFFIMRRRGMGFDERTTVDFWE